MVAEGCPHRILLRSFPRCLLRLISHHRLWLVPKVLQLIFPIWPSLTVFTKFLYQLLVESSFHQKVGRSSHLTFEPAIDPIHLPLLRALLSLPHRLIDCDCFSYQMNKISLHHGILSLVQPALRLLAFLRKHLRSFQCLRLLPSFGYSCDSLLQPSTVLVCFRGSEGYR